MRDAEPRKSRMAPASTLATGNIRFRVQLRLRVVSNLRKIRLSLKEIAFLGYVLAYYTLSCFNVYLFVFYGC